MTLTRSAKLFIGMMVMAAAAMIAGVTFQRQIWHPVLTFTLFLAAVATSRMKVKLPGLNGNMSVNLPFLLLSVVTINATESILIGLAAIIVQTWPKRGARFIPVQLLFNISMIALACGGAGLLFHASSLTHSHWYSLQLLLAAATATFFLGQTVPVSIIVALTDGEAVRGIWSSIAQLSFPYYVISAGVTSMVSSTRHPAGSAAAVLLFPVMYGVYRSYKLYFVKEGEKENVPLALAAVAGAGRV